MRGAYELLRPAERAQKLRPHWRRAQAWLRRQRRSLAAGDARTGSSVTLAAVSIAALFGYALLPGNAAVSNAPGNRLAEAGPRAPVRILDQNPRGESCDQQVWPYIAQSCLKVTAEPVPATTGSAPQQSAAAPAAVPSVSQPAQTQTEQTQAAQTQAAPEKQASLSVPDSAGARAGQMEYVPLPVPRPPLEQNASLDENDDLAMPALSAPLNAPPLDAPPWGMRRGAGTDGRGYDDRREQYAQPYGDQQYMPPREIRRAQRHERRSRRHGIHIGGFNFRF